MGSKHKLRIQVTDQPASQGLVSARTVSLRERLLARLLGKKQRVTVLVPGNQVGTIEILKPDPDLTALAQATGVMSEPGGDGR